MFSYTLFIVSTINNGFLGYEDLPIEMMNRSLGKIPSGCFTSWNRIAGIALFHTNVRSCLYPTTLIPNSCSDSEQASIREFKRAIFSRRRNPQLFFFDSAKRNEKREECKTPEYL